MKKSSLISFPPQLSKYYQGYFQNVICHHLSTKKQEVKRYSDKIQLPCYCWAMFFPLQKRILPNSIRILKRFLELVFWTQIGLEQIEKLGPWLGLYWISLNSFLLQCLLCNEYEGPSYMCNFTLLPKRCVWSMMVTEWLTEWLTELLTELLTRVNLLSTEVLVSNCWN